MLLTKKPQIDTNLDIITFIVLELCLKTYSLKLDIVYYTECCCCCCCCIVVTVE